MTLHVEALYRYPVKGLSAERLSAVTLTVGAGLPGDRHHAIAHGGTHCAAPESGWLPKSAFLALHKLPALAALEFREDSRGRLFLRAPGRPEVSGDPRMPAERAALEDYLAAFAGCAVDDRPQLLTATECAFTDARQPLVSIVSRASLEDLERSLGQDLDIRRFRANLVVAGGLPWQEFDWRGAEITCGGARLRVLEPILRCAAILAEPGTGRRGPDLLRPLTRRHGEAVFGVYAEVADGGHVAQGDAVTAPPGGHFPSREGFGLR